MRLLGDVLPKMEEREKETPPSLIWYKFGFWRLSSPRVIVEEPHPSQNRGREGGFTTHTAGGYYYYSTYRSRYTTKS